MLIEPLIPGFGAMVHDVDLANLTLEEWKQIHTAFLENGGLLLVRGQHHLCDMPGAVKDFASRFGSLEDNEKYFISGRSNWLHEAHREILCVGNALGDRSMLIKVDPSAELLWHCDDSFRDPQPMGSCFFCVEAPDEGAATFFASGTLAWRALPDTQREQLRKFAAVHDYGYLDAVLRRENPDRPPLPPEAIGEPQLRPLAAVHPETAAEALYVPGCHIASVVDLSNGQELDRDGVIAPLLAHATQPEHSYRHEWLRGDCLVWDNRCTLHAPSAFDDDQRRRLMWRLTMLGEQISPSPAALRQTLAGGQAAL